MKILITAFQDERVAYMDVWPAPDDARQPTTAEEMEAVRPCSLASNHQLEVVEDREATRRVHELEEQRYTRLPSGQRRPDPFFRYWAPWMPGRPLD